MPAAALTSLMAVLPSASFAQSVDTELILSFDVSGSISTEEYELQRDGYVNAFSLPNIRSAVLGQNGFAIAVQQWASSAFAPSISWTNLNSATAYDQFLIDLGNMSRAGGGGTNVAAGLSAATSQITTNTFTGSKLIIDISGDGTSNVATTQAARDAASAAGITVNGLPIGGAFIDAFYQNNVITPDGSIYPAASFDDFDKAVTAKIQAETGAGPGPTSSVPGPLPLLGVGVAYSFARKIRSRIKLSTTQAYSM
ncbi:DUF1194 domain-containing protein [Synechococcus sp. BA-132 BA5]|uniref:DUF1194 domain-containing protein n=1 Tax=Synechococcus sp. BA-132 BA5 TaxID=3110252 RepID=UPI002B220773|nr:DUF1194 domain-containing protein [Synechococcus sp. BA-132 BA5]